VGAVDAAEKAHSRNRPTATDEKKSSLFLVVIYLADTISGKSLKIVATGCPILKLGCIKFKFGWGSLIGFKGGYF